MQRPLDPVSLQHFVAVCEEGNIARAASRESLVASALSKRIAALEAEVGVPLLVRRRRGVDVTPAGQALLVRARELLAGLQRVRVELDAFGHGAQGSVRVLASPSALTQHLPDDIAAFMAQHPAIRLSLDERLSPEIVRSVHDGSADVGVLWDLIDLEGLSILPYRRDRLCVAMTPGHVLARRPSLRFPETLAHASICVGPGGQMDQLLRRQAALLGRVAPYRMQVSSVDAACRLIGAGLGLAVLPQDMAMPYAGAAGRLALVPLAEPWAVRRFVIVTRPAATPSDAARELAKSLAERAE
jgi:DNA-binding transcriptional LysR family regulator